MRVLITGVNGLLGKDIASVFLSDSSYEVYGVGRADCKNKKINYYCCDLTNEAMVSEIMNTINPEIIIHCAAYTKLDACEENREYAHEVNVEVTRFLAKQTCKMVYISSDAVFSGENGNYSETAHADYINYYGQTKYEAEEFVLRNTDAIVIRSSIYGYNLNENRSIAEWGGAKLIKGESVNGFSDVFFNPLYSMQVATIIKKLIEINFQGLVHLGSSRVISKYEFFREIAKHLNAAPDLVIPKSVEAIEFKASRTKNTSLNIAYAKSIISDYEKYSDLDRGISSLVNDMIEKGRI